MELKQASVKILGTGTAIEPSARIISWSFGSADVNINAPSRYTALTDTETDLADGNNNNGHAAFSLFAFLLQPAYFEAPDKCVDVQNPKGAVALVLEPET